jgi:sulfur relay (sulfurtransferase) DsrF/TusC family protein
MSKVFLIPGFCKTLLESHLYTESDTVQKRPYPTLHSIYSMNGSDDIMACSYELKHRKSSRSPASVVLNVSVIEALSIVERF